MDESLGGENYYVYAFTSKPSNLASKLWKDFGQVLTNYSEAEVD